MDKAPHIYQGCLRKIRLPDVDVAIKVAKKRNLRYYYCNCCLGYHLTKSEYGSWAPEPPKKVKPKLPPRIRTAANSILDILREDEEYYYCPLNPKKKYKYLHYDKSPWESAEVENEMRIRKSVLEERGYKVI